MKNFNDYAEKAIARYGLAGLNSLGRELNISSAAISQFNTGKALPSDDTMIKLAELAGLPKEEALIDLNLWRSKDKPEVQKIWQRLSKMLGLYSYILFFSLFASTSCFAANSSLFAENQVVNKNIYYATNVRRLLGLIKEKLTRLFYSLFFQDKQAWI